jgi:hypothetical protein
LLARARKRIGTIIKKCACGCSTAYHPHERDLVFIIQS